MKIVVIGGTGLIGSKVVSKLTEQGHEAVAAAPTTGVNTLTGEGLAAVLKGAQVIVDVSNSPSFEERPVMDFFKTSTTNLLKYGVAAGVGHLAALSVVGTDGLSESILPSQDCSRKAHQGVKPAILHHSRSAVLRVRQGHRRLRDPGKSGPSCTGTSAYGRRRCCQGGRESVNRNTAERHS